MSNFGSMHTISTTKQFFHYLGGVAITQPSALFKITSYLTTSDQQTPRSHLTPATATAGSEAALVSERESIRSDSLRTRLRRMQCLTPYSSAYRYTLTQRAIAAHELSHTKLDRLPACELPASCVADDKRELATWLVLRILSNTQR